MVEVAPGVTALAPCDVDPDDVRRPFAQDEDLPPDER
jgi:hypothetical protein